MIERSDYRPAEKLLDQSLSTYEASLGESSTRAARTRLILGELMLTTKRLNEAEPMLLAAWSILVEKVGDQHPHALQTAGLLAHI